MILGAEGEKYDVQEGIALTETQILLLTLWGEGRGEPVEGRIAIGSVIRNRVKWGKWGESYAKVCLAPWQFSCWRREGGASNYDALLGMAKAIAQSREITDPIVRECGWIAHGIIGAWLRDNTKGATHYYNPDGMKPKGRVPSWAANLTPVTIVGPQRRFC
jgi:N-acetylmuramoyl-L-alanine amidase